MKLSTAFSRSVALRLALSSFVIITNGLSGKPYPNVSPSQSRDEKLWRRALEIQRKAIVIDTHNDVTTPMTNDDYDLSGDPPAPYRTSIERMKQGGLTAEFFSLYIKPWYVTHGGAARRTLDMIDSVYRAIERQNFQTARIAGRKVAQFLTLCSADNLAEARRVPSLWQGSSPAKARASSRLSRAHGHHLRSSTHCSQSCDSP